MNRDAFGALGALLSDADLARALAALGAFYPLDDVGDVAPRMAGDPGFAQRMTAEHGRLVEVPVRMVALAMYARHQRAWEVAHGAPLAWDPALAQWQAVAATADHVRLRIEDDPDNHALLDPAWLAQLMGTPGLDAYGCYVEHSAAAVDATWEWPLRIGVARTADAPEVLARLRAGRFNALYDVQVVDGGRVDLLLLPASLSEAMQADLGGVRASVALVLGGTDATFAATEVALGALRERVGAAAVAIAHVPAVERRAWLTAVVAELAHNATLDVALLRAARGVVRNRFREPDGDAFFDGELTPPWLFADRAFIDRAVLAETARRMGGVVASLPARATQVAFDRSFSGVALPAAADTPLGDVGDVVAREAGRIAWHHETGDATVLADFRRRIEDATGAALQLPPLVLRAADAVLPPPLPRIMRTATRALPPPFATRSTPPTRFVQVATRVAGGDGAWLPTAAQVGAGERCALDTFIGAARDGMLVAGAGLDESTLPPSTTGHPLTLAFTPLWHDDTGAIPPAQTAQVHLPTLGDSEHATFHFVAPATLADLRARIVVLFGLRVLQTLILDVPNDTPGVRATLRLEPENRVARDFGERTQAPAFEGALIANDNPAGTPGITGITGDGVAFIEPVGLDAMVEQIRKELAVLNQGEDTPDDIVHGLDDPRVDTLLRNLAARGAWFTKQLKAQPSFAPLLGAARLQVVDARRGAYLPVEFFYDGKAPLPTAARCPHAVAALEDASVHDTCPHAKDAAFHCPAAFWGFSRCIERQPVGGQGMTIFRQPTPGANTLRPLAKALLAASRRVRPQDLDPPAGIEAVLGTAAAGVARAQSWTEWQQKIASEAPSLLVMLPHSLDSPDFPGIPALEINGTNLASVNLDREFVAADPAGAPVVLLLGCSTALPRIPFLNFVGEFKDNGAAVVIGTIALIRGRQTGAFVGALLGELRAAATAGGTFDEVLLRVKRRLLAGGDPFVLSLMAYGDTGWRIEA